jgi:plasmid stabilization system protein ParE
MAYRVEVSRRAERDIEEAFEYIHTRAPLNAIRWPERAPVRGRGTV